MWHLGTKTRNLPKICELEEQAQTPLDSFIPEFEAKPPKQRAWQRCRLGWEQEGARMLVAAGRTPAAPTFRWKRCSPSEQRKQLR